MVVKELPHPGQVERLPETFYRLSVEHYQQMVAAGIFDEEDAVELLEGRIVNKMPKSRLHVIVTNLILRVLMRFTAHTHHVESQEPITLATSEPEPDIVVLRGQVTDYADHPQGEYVSLLVEVADSSLQRDQTWKKQLYAEAGIPVYWVVNLPEKQIEVYTDPTGRADNPTYRQLRTYGGNESVPIVIDGQEIGAITVVSIFPE